MFSCQSTPEFNCDEPTMNNYPENCWSDDQSTSNYEVSPDVGTDENYFNYADQSACPALPNTQFNQFNQNVSFDTASYFYSYTPQSNIIQYPLTPDPVPYPAFHVSRPHPYSVVMAKRHRAMITFEQTRTGNFKAIVKRKHKRTVFTTEQLQTLEEIFKRKQYISREDRTNIVKQLQLSDKAVKIWFQNRRLKDKREQKETEEHNRFVLEERSSPDIARLDYVESRLNEKTDEFGFVTLDDTIMKDLFNVIDDFLTYKPPHPIEETIDSDDSPIYEPISPASASDSNDEENASSWKPTEPNESLQRLFDLQNMLSL